MDKAAIISLSVTLEEEVPYLQCVDHTSKDMTSGENIYEFLKFAIFIFPINNVI